MLKRWKLLVGILFLLVLALLGSAQWYASYRLTPERLVKYLEARYNARVEVGSATVSLFSRPAVLSLKNLSLVPRDDFANNAVPLEKRPKLEGIKQVGFGVADVEVKFSPWSALFGDIHLHEVRMDFIRLNTEQSEAGDDGLAALLTPREKTLETTEKQPAEQASTAKKRTLRIDNLALTKLRVDSRSLKKRQTFSLQDMSIKLQDIHVDGKAMATGSKPRATIEGKFMLLGKRKAELLNLNILATTGDGANMASLPFSVTIKQGSKLAELPALQRMNEKMKKWEKYHLHLQPLPESAEVLADAKVDFLYSKDTLTTQSDFLLKLDAYELALGKNSAFSLADDSCKLEVKLTGDETVTKRILSDFKASLTDKLGGLGETLHGSIVTVFTKEGMLTADNRLSIPMGLSGPLSKPEVEDRVTDILKNALFSSILQ